MSTLAGHIELPAVVDAANTVLLIPAEKERGPPMRAVGGQYTHLACAIAEGDEILAQ